MISTMSCRRMLSILCIVLIGGQGCYHGSELDVRGGVTYSPIELNPNYVPAPQARNRQQKQRDRPVTLGDLDDRGFQKQLAAEQQQQQHPSGISSLPPANNAMNSFQSYARQIHRQSPTLSVISWSCLLVWVLWQMPVCQGVLGDHFICSFRNVRRRPASLLLSAVSHIAPLHLFSNLFVFLHFGPTLRRALRAPLWPLMVGGALVSSLSYLLLPTRSTSGGCLGLSGVTMAMTALYAKMYPTRQLVLMGVLRVQARALLTWMVASSVVLGGLTTSKMAHTSHLGGLLFGMAYYELWKRQKLPFQPKIRN